MSKESEKKMKLFNNNNRKNLSYEDGLWMEENNLFEFSEVSPNNDDEHDKAIEKSGHTFSNGEFNDRSINKRFVREFKKWVDRYERINRNVEWEFENEENVDDKIRLIVNTLFTFHRYRNKFLLIATLTSILVWMLLSKYCVLIPLTLLLIYFSGSNICNIFK